jgi:hypothetical protein
VWDMRPVAEAQLIPLLRAAPADAEGLPRGYEASAPA